MNPLDRSIPAVSDPSHRGSLQTGTDMAPGVRLAAGSVMQWQGGASTDSTQRASDFDHDSMSVPPMRRTSSGRLSGRRSGRVSKNRSRAGSTEGIRRSGGMVRMSSRDNLVGLIRRPDTDAVAPFGAAALSYDSLGASQERRGSTEHRAHHHHHHRHHQHLRSSQHASPADESSLLPPPVPHPLVVGGDYTNIPIPEHAMGRPRGNSGRKRTRSRGGSNAGATRSRGGSMLDADGGTARPNRAHSFDAGSGSKRARADVRLADGLPGSLAVGRTRKGAHLDGDMPMGEVVRDKYGARFRSTAGVTDAHRHPRSRRHRVANWIRAHKKKTACLGACYCCFLIVAIVLVSLVLTLLRLRDAKLTKTEIEIIELCDGANMPFDLAITVDNPCPLDVTVTDVEVHIFEEFGTDRLVSLSLPAFEFVGGVRTYEMSSSFSVDSLPLLASALNDVFNSVPLVLRMEAPISVSFAGIPFSTTLESFMYFNNTNLSEEERSASRFKLQSITFDESDEQRLLFEASSLFNFTSTQLVLHLPPLDMEVRHEAVALANVTTPEIVMRSGWNSMPLSGAIYGSSALVTAALLEDFLDDRPVPIMLTGSTKTQRSDCFVQQLFAQVFVSSNITASTDEEDDAPESNALQSVSVRDVRTATVGVDLKLNFTRSLVIRGNLPPLSLDVVWGDSNETATTEALRVDLLPFELKVGVLELNTSVSVLSSVSTYKLASSVLNGEPTVVMISGSRIEGADTFSRILSGLKLWFRFGFDEDPDKKPTEVSLTSMYVAEISDARLNLAASVSVLNLLDWSLIGSVPDVRFDVLSGAQRAVQVTLNVTMVDTVFDIGVDVELVDEVASGALLQSLVDGDESAVARLKGRPPAVTNNVITDILQHLDEQLSYVPKRGGGDGTDDGVSASLERVNLKEWRADAVLFELSVSLAGLIDIEFADMLPTLGADLLFDESAGRKRQLSGIGEVLTSSLALDNGVLSANASYRVVSTTTAGAFLTRLAAANQSTVMVVRGAQHGSQDVVSRVFRHVDMSFDLTPPTPPEMGVEEMKKAAFAELHDIWLVDGANSVAHVHANITFRDTRVQGTMPAISADIRYEGTTLLVLRFDEEELIGSTEPDERWVIVQLVANVEDQLELERAVDVALKGTSLTLEVTGTPGDTRNVLTNIMQYVVVEAGIGLGDGGAETADGGTVPSFDIALVDTLPDVLSLQFAFELKLPEAVTFRLYVGDVDATLAYNGGVVLRLLVDDLVIVPGNNPLTFRVEVRADQCRPCMEDLFSAFMFGKAVNNIKVDASLTQTTATEPTRVEYTFSFPERAGGDDSNVLRCLDLTDWNLSGNYFLGECSVDLFLELWLENPMDFDVEVDSVKCRLDFDDDGAFLYSPEDDILIGQVNRPERTVLPGGEAVKMAVFVDALQDDGLFDTCIKLFSNYFLEDELVVDVTEGEARIWIDQFWFILRFEILDKRVPKSSGGLSCEEQRDMGWPEALE